MSKHPKTGPASFGYKRHDGMFVAHEEEAPVRLRMFELFAKHQRRQTVAEILNQEGHRTRSGAIFSAQSVTRFLTDKSVIGIEGVVEAIVPSEL